MRPEGLSAEGTIATAPGRVLLLHGIAASSRSMRRLERAVASAGYQTLNLSYPSRKLSVSGLVPFIAAQQEWINGHAAQTHIITYSMGGLVACAYLARHRPVNLGRVVMLAPPNTGSEVADLLSENPIYRRFFGPAGLELTTRAATELTRRAGAIDFPLGIIAGNRFVDPLAWWLIPGPNDGRVAVQRTMAAGMTDHITIPATHFGMMRNRIAIAQTLHFLQHGRFHRNAEYVS